MTEHKLHTRSVEPAQPRAQQRRRLERLWKHPAAGTDKCRLSQSVAPVAQRPGRKGVDSGFQLRHRFTIAREKLRQWLAVRQVEPAAPGHQEFAASRWHCVV